MYSGYLKISFILLVAGVGKRMNLGYPKQFLNYGGRELFVIPLEVAQNSNIVDEIILVTNKENIERVRDICKKYSLDKVKKIVAGGEERQNSVFNGLEVVSGDIVIIHDGARPFLKEKYIEACCEVVANKNVGAVVGVKVKDTIKVVDEKMEVVDTPKRESLVAVQTPQVFKTKTLKKAHRWAMENNFLGTDDAMLVENIGEGVKIVLGDYDNIKITTQEDLRYLRD